MRKILFIFLLLAAGIVRASDKFAQFYPDVIELRQIDSAEKERIRLCQGHKKYDKQPTGFYVEEGKKVIVDVEIITPAASGVMPALTVGTMGFNVDGRNTGVETALKPGQNTITNHSGGLIWLSFINDGDDAPQGEARITFTEASEHVRAPRFVFQKTTRDQFKEMVDTYTVPDILYQSDYIVVVSTREAAMLYTYSTEVNKVEWMASIHTLLEKESAISGMDNNDPNPVHHRLKAGEVRFLLVENAFHSPHASSGGYTGYPHGSRVHYLTKLGTPTSDTWMLGHELGHQHQQPAYMINKSSESTVNIYSYVVEQHFRGNDFRRVQRQNFTKARTTYCLLPVAKRQYDMEDDDLEALIGFNRDDFRFIIWEQLFYIFGHEFYQNLHRIVREEKIIGGGEQERRAYLIWKASLVSGYDLTEYYNQWGIRVTDSKLKAQLRAKMAHAKSQSVIRDLSEINLTANDLFSVNIYSVPGWAPIKMNGAVKGEEPLQKPLSRENWTAETSHSGCPDTAIGGDSPGYIIDNDQKTAFAFVKAGESFNGISVPAGEKLWFTIDMGEQQEFNYIQYTHRLDNTYEQLRARQLSILGSNDGSQFTPIVEHYKVDFTANADVLLIDFPAATCRYVKVMIEDWHPTAGKTVQIADFQAGIITKIDYPEPEPLKFNVRVTVDEGIITSQAGVSPQNEDSDYTISFTLAPDAVNPVVRVDGDVVEPEIDGNSYSLTLKVINHHNVNITSQKGSHNKIVAGGFGINIYPNPVKAGEAFHVRVDEELADAEAGIYNLSGIKLFECKLNGNPLSIEQQGMYILKIKKDSQEVQTKIVVR